MLDITGKNSLNLTPQNSIEPVDLSHQPKGVYFVELVSKAKTEIVRANK